MKVKPIRSWCARYRYPDRKPFLYGSVVVEADRPLHEVEEEARQQLLAGMMSHLPIGTAEPTLIDLLPGQIWFVPEAQT